MKSNKKIILSILSIGIIFIVSCIMNYSHNNLFMENNKTLIFQGLKSVKVTEDKFNIEGRGIKIVGSMPIVHYKDKEVERYINTYIRKNINEFINIQKQQKDTTPKHKKMSVNLNYDISFQDKQILNIIIYKDIKVNDEKYERIKDSYVFDLETGQRIYLDNFLKNNENYADIIKEYISENNNKTKIDNDKIKIDKYTNYCITNEGIGIYFNPYQTNKDKGNCDFKIPYDIFTNKIKKVDSSPIVAQVDTQTITKNMKYINSIINIPIVITDNKSIERKINNMIKQDIMDSYYKIEEEAKIYYSSSPKEEIRPYIYNINFEVKKNSNNMLSLVVTYYQDSGGAHGFYENESYNIYMKDGENLNLEKLFMKDKNYKIVIDDIIRKQIKEGSNDTKNNINEYDFRGISMNQKFYTQDNNIVIYFDLYEIAPYAAGIPEFYINVENIRHILDENYIDILK